MKQNNPQIAARILKRDEFAPLREPDRAPKPERKHYASVAERIAESSVCIGNWRFEGAQEAFPNEPSMRSVEQYYPYAKGGPLLVDSPTTKGEKADCARKAEHLSKIGYRYLIVEADMEEFAARERLMG